jgi:capsular exopolysaccharide synthesis family protein
VVGPADLPDSPASPNIIQNAILALIAGIALGIAVALLRERLDDRLRDREDLEFRLGAPVLAVVPRVTSWRRGKKPLLVSVTEPQSAAAESYKALRTSVQHFALQRDAKVILVTSASAGEGKTATTANLGVALAHAGKRTILVSADLRKPRVHRFFNVGSLPGLTGVLTNNKTPWEVMERDVGVDHLQILPSGAVPTNPAELLGSDQMGRLIASLREVADFVLLDTAPILPVADALTLSAFVDGVLFVADSGATTGKAVDHSLKQLQQVNAPVFGAILNNFDPGRAGPYYYSHYRYYSTYTQTDQSADRVKNGTTGIRRLSRR